MQTRPYITPSRNEPHHGTSPITARDENEQVLLEWFEFPLQLAFYIRSGKNEEINLFTNNLNRPPTYGIKRINYLNFKLKKNKNVD